jgi:hypothetical protein
MRAMSEGNASARRVGVTAILIAGAGLRIALAQLVNPPARLEIVRQRHHARRILAPRR